VSRTLTRVVWEAYLIVDGIRFQCVEFFWNFSLNQIPVARVGLAVGRDAASLATAHVHTEAGHEALLDMKPAKVVLSPKGDWDEGRVGVWEAAGEQVVFEGYIGGTGYQTSAGSLQYVVSLVHWLSDLQFSSIVSNQTHPGSPANYQWRASFQSTNFTGGEPKPQFLSTSAAAGVFSSDRIRDDLWGQSLHQLFCGLSKHNMLHMRNTGLEQQRIDDLAELKVNQISQDALKRIECNQRVVYEKDGGPAVEFTPTDHPRGATEELIGETPEAGAMSPYHVPLKFASAAASQDVATAIGRWCSHRTLDTYYHTSVWDVLVGGLLPQFGAALVPKIRTAQVIPFTPGLRRTYSTALLAEDWVSISPLHTKNRPIYGTVLTPKSLASATDGLTHAAPLNFVGGFFSPYTAGDVEHARGMLRFANPPPWLNELLVARAYRSNRDGKRRVAVRPKAREATPKQLTYRSIQDYYTAYAKAAYYREVLQGRQATLTGKVRFDVAPGTTVRVVAGARVANKKSDMIGEVLSVTGQLNSITKTAYTSFQLGYVRTDAENESDATSTDSHPLFETTFAGAPLLYAYHFDAKG